MKKKPHHFAQGKSVQKGLTIYTYRFLGMPITMHYVRTLCDTYFLSYNGFSCWSFVEKTSGEAKHETQSVFKFSDVLFALRSDGPPAEASSDQEQYYIRSP